MSKDKTEDKEFDELVFKVIAIICITVCIGIGIDSGKKLIIIKADHVTYRTCLEKNSAADCISVKPE